MKHICYVVAISVAFLGGCSEGLATSDDEREVIIIANRFIVSNLGIDPVGYDPVVHDDGDSWLVSYHILKDRVGAQPIVTVDKDTKTVIATCDGGQ